MKTTAIIAEFNPFHNGHRYIIEQARLITGADSVIVIMSGDWTQSGKPAIISKEERTRAALMNGADVVLLLPAAFSSCAQIFAYGAVSIINGIGCVDTLCFGSEYDDITLLHEAAGILTEEPEGFRERLMLSQRQGMSYPAALSYALSQTDGFIGRDFSLSPNTILGIEYIKALKELGSDIRPVAVKRALSDHGQTRLSETEMTSATSIRAAVLSHNLNDLKKYMPQNSLDILLKADLFDPDLLTPVVIYRLFIADENELAELPDADPELIRHIKKCFLSAPAYSFDSFIRYIQPKNTTYARVCRLLTSMLTQNSPVNRFTRALYARVLGFRGNTPLLKELKEKSRLPVITNVKDGRQLIAEYYEGDMRNEALSLFDMDIYAGDLYRMLLHGATGSRHSAEEQQMIVKV